MPRRKFNIELLTNKIKEDNAILIGDYSEKLTRNNEISYICSCGKECNKNFYIAINEGGGFKCPNCVYLQTYEKIKATNLEKYGVEHPMYSNTIKDKIKATNLEKYGVEYPTQLVEFQEKAIHTAKSYKNYIIPSGKSINVQGFEPYALDELYKLYSEDDIITDRKFVPKFEYIDNSVKKIYFPDIYVKSINKIIEVKSTWTYRTNEKKCILKGKACINKAYMFEIWIYDKRGKNKTIMSNFAD